MSRPYADESAGVASIQSRALKKQSFDEPVSDENLVDVIDRISKCSEDEIPIQPGGRRPAKQLASKLCHEACTLDAPQGGQRICAQQQR